MRKLGELKRYAANLSWIKLCSELNEQGVRPSAGVSASTGRPKPLEDDVIDNRDHITAHLEARGAVS